MIEKCPKMILIHFRAFFVKSACLISYKFAYPLFICIGGDVK